MNDSLPRAGPRAIHNRVCSGILVEDSLDVTLPKQRHWGVNMLNELSHEMDESSLKATGGRALHCSEHY